MPSCHAGSLGEGVTAALSQSAETALRLNKNVILFYRQPFANLAELGAVPGVDPAKLELRKSRILFN